MSPSRSGAPHYWVALRAMLVLTAILGVAYPLVITGIGQLVLPAQANGFAETVNGQRVGSALIGQSFSDAAGNPLAVTPVGPRGSGDGRVAVVWAQPGSAIASEQLTAERSGSRLVRAQDSPPARLAFIHQEWPRASTASARHRAATAAPWRCRP